MILYRFVNESVLQIPGAAVGDEDEDQRGGEGNQKVIENGPAVVLAVTLLGDECELGERDLQIVIGMTHIALHKNHVDQICSQKQS